MIENIFYLDAKKSIRTFISEEYPTFNNEMMNKLLDYFYKFLNYEEEGSKIRPTIIFTNNVNFINKNIPNVYKLVFYKDDDASRFNHRIKTLMAFCRNEWNIFINQNDDKIEYGLIKALNSIKEKSLKELIFEDEIKETMPNKMSLFTLEVINKSLIVLEGIKEHITNVSFSFSEDTIANWNDVIRNFVDVSVTKLKTTKKKLKEIKILYENIFKKVFKNLHGTICLVVDKEYKPDKDTMLADGTWLEQPIELSKLFIQTKSYSEAKLIGISDLIISMLDYDGITVVDNAGRIRAYNVFVESKAKNAVKPIGGARRRAAQTLIDSKNKKFIGVYFQSQDGDCFFKYVKSRPQKLKQKVEEEAAKISITQEEIEKKEKEIKEEEIEQLKGQLSIIDVVNNGAIKHTDVVVNPIDVEKE